MASRRVKGTVEGHDEYFRAHVQCRIDGRKKHIRGPVRAIRQDAEQDLFELRAAGSEAGGRNVEAMNSVAKELKGKEHPTERGGVDGGVEKKGRSHRAHLQMYVEGKNLHIRGPSRILAKAAEADLQRLRAAGLMSCESKAALVEALEAVSKQLQEDSNKKASSAAAKEHHKALLPKPEARAEETSADTRSSVAPGEGLAAASSDVAMAAAVPYKSRSVEADEPWQMERRKSKCGREEDAWLNITGATHDNSTFGLDRSARLFKDKAFSFQVLSECEKLLQKFIGERASVGQIRELLSILPAGPEHKLGIEPQLLDAAGDAVDISSYTLLLDYRKRISDLVSCAAPAPDTKRVVLKVIESSWASDVAAGSKFFECVANKNCWSNLFKGLTAGDLFVIAYKGMLQVAAVGEVASAPCAKASTRDSLYSMLLPQRRAALDAYLAEAATFDFVQFRKVHCPPQPLAARDMLGRIGAAMPAQWQGVLHISTDEGVHTRLSELIEPWPSHINDARTRAPMLAHS